MSGNLIKTDRDVVFTEFNSSSRPWRLSTASIYHDPSLVTDLSYLEGTSAYNAHLNPLTIESSGTDIYFYTDENHKTEFNSDVDICGLLQLEKLNVEGDICFNGNLTMTGQFKLLSLEVEGDVSYIQNVDISQTLKAGNNNDTLHHLGKARIGFDGVNNNLATFGHISTNTLGTTYGLGQNSSGRTFINSLGGENIQFRINNNDVARISSLGNLGIGLLNDANNNLEVNNDISGKKIHTTDGSFIFLSFGSDGNESTFPSGQGLNRQVLSTNGSGTLSWGESIYANDASFTTLTFGGNGNENTFPSSQGLIGQFLSTDGAGTISWSSAGSGGTTVEGTSLRSFITGNSVNSSDSISIGRSAGETGSNTKTTLLGAYAGSTNASEGSIALGYYSGNNTLGQKAVAIGYETGVFSLQVNSIAIGEQACYGSVGRTDCHSYCIGIGTHAGRYNLGEYSIAIGYKTHEDSINTTPVGTKSVSIGYFAGQLNQQSDTVAIGNEAGKSNQSSNTVAIGKNAGRTGQSTSSISIGNESGYNGQDSNSVAIGNSSGYSLQSQNSIAIGNNAGNNNQGQSAIEAGAIALGNFAGNIRQNKRTIGIGWKAGEVDQSSNSIAIGENAGNSNQGSNCIAIGSFAGETDQEPNTIVLNAEGVALNTLAPSGTYIKPIRNLNNANKLLYNTTTGEITYQAESSDVRLKHNKKDINNGLEIIRQLKPQFYKKSHRMYRTDLSGNAILDENGKKIFFDKNYNGDIGIEGYQWKYEAGLIAQEINELDDLSFAAMESFNIYDNSNDLIDIQPMSINYETIFTYNIAASKELDIIVEKQKEEILKLKEENEAMKAALNMLLEKGGYNKI